MTDSVKSTDIFIEEPSLANLIFLRHCTILIMLANSNG